jgi:hypothetical protein
MTSNQLVVGILDDSPGGLALMEELAEAVVRELGIDMSSVDPRRASDRRSADRIASSGACHLLLIDLVWPMEGGSPSRVGLDLAEVAKDRNPRTVVAIITGKEEEERNFGTDARARGADFALTWREAFAEGKAQSAKRIARELAPPLSVLVPLVESVQSSTIGLVGMDTVAFSERDDRTQVDIVRSFLSHTQDCWRETAVPMVRPVFLFTGDGLLLGLIGDRGPRLALDLGIAMWRRHERLAAYGARFAVHAGPTTVATLTSGSLQLVGTAVNWLVRALNATRDRGLTVTNEFRDSVLQGGREEVDGVDFDRREVVAKHGRPLVVWDATWRAGA